jgi:malonate-semialdehyde dehydrogenase (acetylating) / methylmalonate-semialdehyde dehydrogenase
VSTSVEHTARTVLSIDPATGEVWRRWTASSQEDIAATVQRARVAQPAWAERPLGGRGRVLERFRRLLFEHRGEMASLIEREAGKPAAEAMMADVITTLDVARYCARRASHVLSTRTIVPGNIALWRAATWDR